MVAEDIISNHLSYREAARTYEVPNHHMVQKWERIYLEEGSEGLYIERRGRACADGGVQKGRTPKSLKPEVEEDLIAEVQRLRAENAYLKKLNALVSQRVYQTKKHK